jgi:glycosyltransferase involved in cell wall biosynthesis
MIMNIKYSLVIPCFNEEKSLEVLLHQLVVVVERLNNNVEFVLVNNGSTDCTIEILSNLSSKNITLVSLDKNVGYGGGIKAGLLKCKGDFIGWIHADLQYSLFEVISELDKITSKTEYIKGKRRGRTLFQNFISLNMSVFETLMFKSLVYDINAQPTLFRRHFLVHLTDMPDDFSIDLYSYVMAKRFNLNISRFKVNFVKRSYGKSSWNSGLVSLIKMSLRTVRYSIYLRRNF